MKWLTVLGLGLLVVACGGGGGGSAGTVATATGYFKDSNTQGLSYVSGGQSGVTGADGSFVYEVGQPVKFSIGGVTLGSVTVGQSVVTPVDLVANGTVSSTSVQNLTRFLMMLDSDQDPTNGITIANAVRVAAANWGTVDFGQADATFAATMTPLSQAASADGAVHALPTAAAAQSHLGQTVSCVRAGAYKATYTGTDSGRFAVLVGAADGLVSGVGYGGGSYFTITGSSPLALATKFASVGGVGGGNVTWNGQLTSPDTIAGTWVAAPSGSGTFSGTRVGGALNAKYRFTGSYVSSGVAPTSYGLYTFDVDTGNNVTGIAYDLPTQTETKLSGTVSGSSLTGATSNAQQTFSATINVAAGTLTSGVWRDNGQGVTGTFKGDGCQLN